MALAFAIFLLLKPTWLPSEPPRPHLLRGPRLPAGLCTAGAAFHPCPPASLAWCLAHGRAGAVISPVSSQERLIPVLVITMAATASHTSPEPWPLRLFPWIGSHARPRGQGGSRELLGHILQRGEGHGGGWAWPSECRCPQACFLCGTGSEGCPLPCLSSSCCGKKDRCGVQTATHTH